MATRVLIIHYTPPGIVGGVEYVMQEQVRLLSDRGFRVQVVAGRPGAKDLRAHVIPEIEAATDESAVVEEELAAGVVSPRFHRRRKIILDRLTSLAADADFLIVHNAFTLQFSMPLTAALWELAATRRYGSVVAWCHDLAWTNPLYLPAMHDGYPWDLLRVPAPNTRYVTVSVERKRQLAQIWRAHTADIRVIPNGVDVKSFLRLGTMTCDLVERYRLLDRDIVLLLPVRITRRKNIEAAIRATGCLKERGLDVMLLVSGPVAPHHPGRSAAYLDGLKRLRDERDVRDEIVFLADELGQSLDDQTVGELYSISDALLLPSMQEGFGLPILEAGISRVPVISSDIPIFREVAGGEAALFEPEGPAGAIANMILAALDTPAGRLRRRVLNEYRWDVIVDTLLLPLLGISDQKESA
ncbi:MAG: glycosyltransferase family 4 protein [Chloroflexota bacterium]